MDKVLSQILDAEKMAIASGGFSLPSLWSKPRKWVDSSTVDELHFWVETIKGVDSVQKQFCNEYLELLTTCVFSDVKLFFFPVSNVSGVEANFSAYLSFLSTQISFDLNHKKYSSQPQSVITSYHGRCCGHHMPPDSKRKELWFLPKFGWWPLWVLIMEIHWENYLLITCLCPQHYI